MIISPVHERLAQLRIKQKTSGLTPGEQQEMEVCLDWHVNYCWKHALLNNYSLMASMTNDIDWQHDICGELDKW